MTVKRNTLPMPAAYENRVERDPKSKDFGKKLHFPLHADGTVSSQGYRKAADALSAHKMMVAKADELAHTEGYSAHDEGLDILSNPYSGRMARAWAEGWNKADAEAEMDERESLSDEEEAAAIAELETVAQHDEQASSHLVL